jgi:hypothetical protein
MGRPPKLTPHQRQEALARREASESLSDIARTYGVAHTTIARLTVWHVNPTGKFVIGGPDGDCGLTGRKIIMDTYGRAAQPGGGIKRAPGGNTSADGRPKRQAGFRWTALLRWGISLREALDYPERIMDAEKLSYVTRKLERLSQKALQSAQTARVHVVSQAIPHGGLHNSRTLMLVGSEYARVFSEAATAMAQAATQAVEEPSEQHCDVIHSSLVMLRDALSNDLADFFRSQFRFTRDTGELFGNQYLSAADAMISEIEDDLRHGISEGSRSNGEIAPAATATAKNELTTKAPCNICHVTTIHSVLQRHERRVPIPASEYSYNERWDLIQCGGCGTISARRAAWEIPDNYFEEFWPTRLRHRRPVWLQGLSEPQLSPGSPFPSDNPLAPLHNLIVQTYDAYNNNLLTLTAMGVRAVLDMAMNRLVGDVGNFAQKLDACERNGHLSVSQKSHLNTVIEAGNAAAHRGFTPSEQDVTTLLQVMEHLIEAAFVHPQSVAGLGARVPTRKTANRVAAASKPPLKS